MHLWKCQSAVLSVHFLTFCSEVFYRLGREEWLMQKRQMLPEEQMPGGDTGAMLAYHLRRVQSAW